MSCKRIIVLFYMFVLPSVYTTAGQAGPVVLKSPNGELEISIATLQGLSLQAEGGQLAYCVSFRGRSVLEWSNLGLIIEGSSVLGTAVRIESSQTSNQDETWTSVQGKANPIRNHYNAVTVQTVETGSNGRHLVLEARAYVDGVAFRYIIPDQLNVKELRIYVTDSKRGMDEGKRVHVSDGNAKFTLNEFSFTSVINAK